MNEEQLERDLQTLLFALAVTAPAGSEGELDREIREILRENPIRSFEVLGYEAYEVFERKMKWHQVPFDQEEGEGKVLHPIIELETEDGLNLSIGYNKAGNNISFSEDGGPIRFYKFQDRDDIVEEFTIIMERLLDL